LLGKLKAPKSKQSGEKISTYACGERIRLGRLAIDVTLCNYLVYFMILDSAVLILAFASSEANSAGFVPLMIYLLSVLVSALLLAFGGK
jgi:NADH:ubiquinone oxidoreductase subunit 3 (subunit A)